MCVFSSLPPHLFFFTLLFYSIFYFLFLFYFPLFLSQSFFFLLFHAHFINISQTRTNTHTLSLFLATACVFSRPLSLMGKGTTTKTTKRGEKNELGASGHLAPTFYSPVSKWR
uniref:Uncharacterized protein n=1 Tax=Trypanosoma vivax (strain Y486) TaxID=1055687 RepID=G0TSM3_TRYVY|nr:hypothetical protein, unlikely [Trypanosoma vivax Y486]